MSSINFEAIRQDNLRRLESMGFQVADSLAKGPNEVGSSLRPIEEIGGRLLALQCAFLYASDIGVQVPEEVIRNALANDGIAGFLVEDESQVMQLPRSHANEKYRLMVGWFSERQFPLAWILGLEHAPQPDGVPLQGEPASALLQFVGLPTANFSRWITTFKLRPQEEVIALEDLFYCAHNAVRSAQQGEETVPEDFDPVFNGGVIHERRHALSWALSPGVSWNDVPLNT